MITYLIDAFNLLHKISALDNSSSPRRDLINYIKRNHLTGSRQNRVILFFDGYETNDTPREQEYKLFFSDNRTADYFIRDHLEKYKSNRDTIVVSADNEVISSAETFGARVIKPQHFIRKGSSPKSTSTKKVNLISPSEASDINKELSEIWIEEKKRK